MPGVTLIALSSLGLCLAVPNYWRGCIHNFSWDGRTLRFRTVFSRRVREQAAREIVKVAATRPNSRQEQSGTWRLVRFRDGSIVKLHVGILQNAHALFTAVKTAIEQHKSDQMGLSMASVLPDDHLWPLIRPHLADGEAVDWTGRRVCANLWSEISGEMVFGMIPAAMGMAVLILPACLGGINSGTLFASLNGTIFVGIRVFQMISPWRIRRMLRNTAYAVTSHRVMIVNGVMWGSQSTIRPRGLEVESYDCSQAMLFEVVGRRRDIHLGGQWRRGRKGRRFWLHSGVLAPDDPCMAEQAIRLLIAGHPKVA